MDKELELEVLEAEKIMLQTPIWYPMHLILRIFDSVTIKHNTFAFALGAVYLLGHRHGIQRERESKRTA